MRIASPVSLGSLTLLALLAACGGGGVSEPVGGSNPDPSPQAQAPADAQAQGGNVAVPGGTPAADATLVADAGAGTDITSSQDLLFTPDAVVPNTPTDTQRMAAATATAKNAANACGAIRPFYWEIGNKNARAVNGSVFATGSSAGYTATTPLSVASSSKWLYAAYVAQKQAGVLSTSDRRFLSMQSGYVSMNDITCQSAKTVDACLAAGSNGAYTQAADGRFDYNGGHMEKHASMIGMGSLDNAGLAKALRAQLGTDVDLSFARPLLAGGAVMTSDAYARFLRKMLSGELRLGALLGSTPVCTNRSTCPTALLSPVPSTESWHYSVGHWVEDDPKVGDGAFSSAGAFGFYPWIDAGKTSYGIVGRMAAEGSGYDSAKCGRLIRKAWATGVAM